MVDRQFTFEQIVGSNVPMISVDIEEFGFTESYRELWEEMKQLPEVNFDFDSWLDTTTESNDSNDPKMEVKIQETTWEIELSNNMGFLDEHFISELNKIIETLNLSENRFRCVSPQGVENNYGGDVKIVFLPKDTIQQLDDNGYGLSDDKWFDL